MDDYYNVKRLALVLSVQAEIEGMKAENMLRSQNNESPAYGSDQFNECANKLENLAYAHNEQL
jgi:hypothetical protein